MSSNTLCRYVGGSHLYKLSTPKSDIDERGVFLNTDPLLVYGFNKNDSVVSVTDEHDVSLQELSHFLKLATRSNTQTLECLSILDPGYFTSLDSDFWELVCCGWTKFMNSEVLMKSLEGYLYGEMRLATGERTGTLGSKRKNALETYGYSYKNCVHLFRLAECGRLFFEHDRWFNSLEEASPEVHQLCLDLKTQPESFEIGDLVSRAGDFKNRMRKAYEHRKTNFVPDLDHVRKTLTHFYTRG
jgi:hypothetical protein